MPPSLTKHVIPHLRFTWGGALGVPEVEIWSNTVAFVDPNPVGTPNAADIAAIVAAVAPLVQTWFVDPSSIIGPAAALKWLKAAWVLANGTQRDVNTVVHDYPAGVFGTSNQGIAIWEQTYALTLRTALNRGRSHAGRIYPPLSGGAPEGKTPYVAAGSANVMASSFGTLLSAIGPAIGAIVPTTLFRPCVISPGDSATGVIPLAETITRVVVDRVADIQHRRTNRVPRVEGSVYPVTF